MLVELSEPNAHGTVTVTLNRPPANALNAGMQEALTKAFEGLAADGRVQRIVLAAGKDCKSFCSGVDVDEMREEMHFDMMALQPEANLTASLRYARMLDAMASCKKPIIAVVQGAAVGAGATLVALADFVVAAQNTRFRYPERHMHLRPAISVPYVVARMGTGEALAHFTDGEFFAADADPRKNGAASMVDRIAPKDLLPVVANRIIGEFEQGKKLAKRLPAKMEPLRGNGEMAALVREAVQLYADRSEQGRANLVMTTAKNLALDRTRQDAFEALSAYCDRLHAHTGRSR